MHALNAALLALFSLLGMALAAPALSQPAPPAAGPPIHSDGPRHTDKTGLFAVERLLGRSHGQVTADILRKLNPKLSAARAQEIAAALNPAMAEAGIKTTLGKAAFLAQLCEESAGFTAMKEFASGEEYEGRADLGNTDPGDGPKYKGRGFIQITGKSNYIQAGNALGLDLVGNPELAENTENAARVAAWYWNNRNINPPADAGDFVRVTKLINGGTNGLDQREQYYAQAKDILGAP